jgi:hypothetical protein
MKSVPKIVKQGMKRFRPLLRIFHLAFGFTVVVRCSKIEKRVSNANQGPSDAAAPVE